MIQNLCCTTSHLSFSRFIISESLFLFFLTLGRDLGRCRGSSWRRSRSASRPRIVEGNFESKSLESGRVLRHSLLRLAKRAESDRKLLSGLKIRIQKKKQKKKTMLVMIKFCSNHIFLMESSRILTSTYFQ